MESQLPPGKVSIVIPCYNDGAYLGDAVASALAQTHPNIEIIVVDDGSTDSATLRALQRCRDAGIVVHRQQNRGMSAARNAGIGLADGEYILPLDSDDKISPTYAREAADVLDSRPEVGIVGGDIETFGLSSARITPTFDGVEGMLFENRLYTCSVTRRADWLAVGGYPEHVPFAEDWIYWLRILSLGRGVHLLEATVWHYRQRPGQLTRSMNRYTWTRAVVHAMRDQPDLYAQHISTVTDYLESKLLTFDSFRGRYGRLNDLAVKIRSQMLRARS